jgi:hypothetical protein
LIDDRSPARRLEALELAIAEWSPYPDTGRVVHEGEGRAGVWIWDQTVVAAALADAGERPQRMSVLPETALQPRGDDGLRLVETLEGCEAQWWAGGLLMASRWWPHPPGEVQWREFRRAAGLEPGSDADAPRAPVALRALERPWIAPTASGALTGRQNVARVYQTLAAALLLLIGIFLGQSVRDQLALANLRQQLTEAGAAAQPRADERTAALSGLEAIKSLRTLDPYPPPLELFAAVSEVVPAGGAHVADWNFANGELAFTIASPTPIDAVSSVKALEAIAGLSGVSVARSDGDRSLRVKLKVLPR